MKKLYWTLFFLVITLTGHAKNPPLRIATTKFTPPFVMEGHNQLYGFDIAMMGYICTVIGRDCKYQLIPFEQLLTTVASNKADVAISGITITPERYTVVDFSIPYMVSDTHFLGKKNQTNTKITAKLLSTSRIGTIAGKVFDEELSTLGAINPTIVHFDEESAMIEALTKGTIDFALMDAPSAIYWQQITEGLLVTIDKPIPYGFGLGIAINKDQTTLANAINDAIRQYQKSQDFKTNYDMYFSVI